MQCILDALDTLAPDACLQALTPYPPEPLLPILARHGYAWRIDTPEGGGARITICRREHADTRLTGHTG